MNEINKTVLVAVTDIFFYTKIRDALLPQGYTLKRAKQSHEVAEKTKDLQPVALIMNMNDDQLNAFEALESLSRLEREQALPILAFANHEEVDTFRRAKALGVTKVVSRNEFSSRTRDLVDEVLQSGE